MNSEAIYVQEITAEEEKELRVGLRCKDGFKMRRCQIIVQSAQAKSAKHIAKGLGCSVQAVRHVIHAFNNQGCGCLVKKSSRPMKGKKAIVEPTRKLSAPELKARVCDDYGCDLLPLPSK